MNQSNKHDQNGTNSGRQFSNLTLRIISALVLGSFVIFISVLGGLPFSLLIAVFAAALLYEWFGMAAARLDSTYRLICWALLVIAVVPLVLGMTGWPVLAIGLGSILIAGLYGLISGKGNLGAAGLAYALLSAISIDQLRMGGESGLAAIIFLFAVVWSTDCMAYVVGRLIGGRKLAPSISPGKTWSGAIGGALFAVIFGWLAAYLVGVHIGPAILIGALILSIVSQIGDLFESAIKRRFGVKDSSNLIPGHGGVMDRVDGLVFAGFALYIMAILNGGLDTPSNNLFIFG